MNPTQDTRNQATWTRPEVGSYFSSLDGFSDVGEKAALQRVRERMEGGPILDLGIGAGRTTSLLQAISPDYLGIDYLPSMVKLAQANHPGARVQTGDARALEGLPDAHFSLVCFSYNGIDAISHADRARVLSAVHRVLRPGGRFLFSTLNLDGPEAHDRPWNPYVGKTRNPLRKAVWLGQRLWEFPVSLINWSRIRNEGEQGAGYSVAPLSAHHFGILAHFTTLERQLEELKTHGFAPSVEVFDSERGEPVRPDMRTSAVRWFHLIAQKPELPA